MFKKLMNSMMTLALVATVDLSWADLIPTNSLFFFGEPEYPSKKN